jgi:hypothetical protein
MHLTTDSIYVSEDTKTKDSRSYNSYGQIR